MAFVKNRILLIVAAVVILLLALGFYIFGLVNKETKSEVLTNDTLRPPAEKEAVVAVEDVPTLTSSPATGPEALTFFFLIPAGILGSRLRKYSHF